MALLTKKESKAAAKTFDLSRKYGAAVSGLAQVQKNLDNLSKGMQKKAMTKAVSESAKAATKLIKNEIPSRYKTVRGAIGWRRPKKRYTKGLILAKVGAAVGKKTKAKVARDAKQSAGRGKRKGVGIAANNIHWWFLGTGPRQQKTTGRSTGRMQPQEKPISRILSRHSNAHMRIVSVYAMAAIRQFVKAADKAGRIR